MAGKQSGKKRVVYWDSCLFLDWLMNDSGRTANELGAMREQVELCQQNELVIVTSVLARTEILESSLTQPQKDLLDGLFKRRSFRSMPVNGRIAKIAHDIREHHRPKNSGDLPTVATPDALHLATAVFLDGCREFYTYDGKDEYPKSGKAKGKRGLIPLNGYMQERYRVAVARPFKEGDLSLLDYQGNG